jgi:3-oxoacyl-[acyl-carrier-protein] synthase-3
VRADALLPFRLVGTGAYGPPQVETAACVGERVGWQADEVVASTGVHERRVAEEPIEEMAAKAGRQALGDGGPPDLLLHAAATPRQVIPDTGSFVGRALGLRGVPCATVHASCLSFLVGMHHAAALIAAGVYRRVLVTSAEQATIGRDWSEPESACLLGDGAGAAVLEATSDSSVGALGWHFSTWPEHADLATVRGAGVARHPCHPETRPEDYRFHMDGAAIYRVARRKVAHALLEAMSTADVMPAEVRTVVPHQPSGRALRALELYGFSPTQVVDILPHYGNCIAASLPMALAAAFRQDRACAGDIVLFVGTGAGLSVGVLIVRL